MYAKQSGMLRLSDASSIFPAASLGWVATDESYLSGLAQYATVKLRGSYGVTGNWVGGNVPNGNANGVPTVAENPAGHQPPGHN